VCQPGQRPGVVLPQLQRGAAGGFCANQVASPQQRKASNYVEFRGFGDVLLGLFRDLHGFGHFAVACQRDHEAVPGGGVFGIRSDGLAV
jgi:hypothetical protein